MKLGVIALVVLVVVTNALAQTSCQWTDPQTLYKYDMSPLTNNKADYFVDVPTNYDASTPTGYRITLNICRPIFSTACSAQGGSQCDACQQWPLDQSPQFQYSSPLGSVTQTYFGTGQDLSGQDHEGVTLYFAGYGSNVQLNFVCDMDAGEGEPIYIKKPTGNSFQLQWTSKYACATNGKAISEGGSSGGGDGGLSGGSIMMIIILVLVVVYLAAGIAYQRVRNQATGLDLVPNKEFWISIPGLVKDGVVFTYHKIRGTSPNYQQL